MNGRLREWLSRIRNAIRPSRSDRDIARELEAHLEIAEDELRGKGMPAAEAARLARVQLGRPTQAMEAIRAARGIPGLDSLWLDVKLGLRVLRKHWALTLVGGLAMSLAMTLGASIFTFVQSRAATVLPLDEGDLVVIVQWLDPAMRDTLAASSEDFERVRTNMSTLTEAAAFRSSRRNLSTPAALIGPVNVAEMSAAGFAVARVKPLLGRYLLPEDERPGAPRVLVIGYSAWQRSFAADPAIVGKTVLLNGDEFTITGVMPSGFGFPVNHRYWIPLQPAGNLTVFARLAPGASIAAAQAEAGNLPSPTLAPSGGPAPQARVIPYIAGISGEPNIWLSRLAPLLGVLLLLPPCLNIAALIYARTVARQGEFAARAALGASRGRIVAQIFVETLLLTTGSAALAIALAPRVVIVLNSMLPSQQPFWVHLDVSYPTFLFAGALAIVAALIAGALPAMRATGRWKLDGLHLLQRASAPRLGAGWTAIVAFQVALSVACVPMVAEATWTAVRPGILGSGFEDDRYLTARVTMDGPPTRLATIRDALASRLGSDLSLDSVSFSEFGPAEERSMMAETEIGARREVGVDRVDDTYLATLGARFLVGDRSSPGAVVVNQAFVRIVLQNRNPLGQGVRLFPMNGRTGESEQHEISAVIADLFPAPDSPKIYLPLDPSVSADGIRLTMRADRGIPADAAQLLPSIATATDPRMRIDDIHTLDEVYRLSSMAEYVMGSALAVLSLLVVNFSVIGIYTLMSFCVVYRRREIGIRGALGASPLRLTLGAFGSVLLPVAISAVLGGIWAILLDYFLAPVLFDSGPEHRLRWLLPAGELFILSIAVLGLMGPVRRVMRIDPAEALREG